MVIFFSLHANYVNMKYNYVNRRDILSTCNIINLTYNKIMSTCETMKVTCDLIMLNVNKILFAFYIISTSHVDMKNRTLIRGISMTSLRIWGDKLIVCTPYRQSFSHVTTDLKVGRTSPTKEKFIVFCCLFKYRGNI